MVLGDRKYGRFIQELWARGVVKLGELDDLIVGLFLVGKRDGGLRLIFDSWQADRKFRAPAKQVLPTAGAWGRIEKPHLFLPRSDVQAAFTASRYRPGCARFLYCRV